jgi:hypothetical protein
MAYSSRNEYLKMLNQMRSNYQNNGNAMINTMDDSTAVGEELSSFAYMNTPTPAMPQEPSFDADAYKEDRNWWQRSMDTGEEFMSNVTEGVWDFVDGIGDFLIMIGGEVGSWFGASTKWAEDAISYDWSTQVHEATMTFNPFDILSGDVFTSQYYQDMTKIGSVEGANELKAQRHAGSWVSEASEDFQSGYNSVTTGIGYVLPSIIVGIATGGASAGVQAAAGGIMLAASGASAAGSGTEQALQEGANFHQAAGSGLISGGIEVGVELLSFGLGKVAGKVLGKSVSYGTKVSGTQFVDAITKASAKELGQTAIEEGTEELITELLSPFSKTTYKGTEAFNEYKDPQLYKNALTSFIGGAVAGGFAGGVQMVNNTSKYSSKGIDCVNEMSHIMQLREQAQNEAKKGSRANQQLISQLENQIGEKIKSFMSNMESLRTSNPKAFENVMKLLQDPNAELSMIEKQLNKSTYDSLAQEISRDMTNMKNGNPTQIVFGTEEDFNMVNEQASLESGTQVQNRAIFKKLDDGTNAIVIDPRYKSQFYEIVGHEAISHGLLDDSQRLDSLESYIENDSELNTEFHKFDDELQELYGKDSKVLRSERMAKFLENYITNHNNLQKIIGQSSSNSFKSKIKSLLNKVKAYLDPKRDSKMLHRISKAIQSITTENTNTTLQPKYSKSRKYMKTSNELRSKLLPQLRKHFIESGDTIVNDYVAINDNSLYIIDSSFNGGNIEFGVFDEIKFPSYYTEKMLQKAKEMTEDAIRRYDGYSGRLRRKVRHDSKSSSALSSKTQGSLQGVHRESSNNEGRISKEDGNNGGIKYSRIKVSGVQASKDYAQHMQDKVLDLKSTRDIYDLMIEGISQSFGADIKIKGIQNLSELTTIAFNTLLNKPGKLNAELSEVIDQVLQSKIEYHVETDSTQIASLVDTTLENHLQHLGVDIVKFKQDSITVFEDILKSNSKDSKVKKILDYFNTRISSLVTMVKYHKSNSYYTIQAFRKIKSIREKIEKHTLPNVANKVGDIHYPELTYYKGLVKGIRLSKSKQGISPKSIDHIISNFSSYTKENLEKFQWIVFNEELRANVDFLMGRQVNGEFPNRALTFEENKAVLDILSFVSKDMSNLIREETIRRHRRVEKSDIETKVLHSIYYSKNKVNRIQKEFDLASSVDTIIGRYFGTNSDTYKILYKDVMDSYNNQLLKQWEFIAQFDQIQKELGIKERDLSKEYEFMGEKMTMDILLDIYCQSQTFIGLQTLQEGGYNFINKHGKGKHLKLSGDDITALQSLIPEKLQSFAEKVLLELYNDSLKSYKSKSDIKIKGFEDVIKDDLYYPTNKAETTSFSSDAANVDYQSLDMSKTSLNQERKNITSKPLKGMSFVGRFKAYTNAITKYGEMYETLKIFDSLMNQYTLMDDGRYAPRSSIMFEINENFSDYLNYLKDQIAGNPIDKTRLGKSKMFSNLVSSTLYGNLSVVLKQTASIPTIMMEVKFSSWLKGLTGAFGKLAKYKDTKANLKLQSGLLAQRWGDLDVVKAQSLSNNLGRVAKLFGVPMQVMDEAVIIMFGYTSAQYEAESLGFGKVGTESNTKEAINILNRIITNTQSNAIPIKMSMNRAGAAGSIRKTLSYFASDLQNKISYWNLLANEKRQAKQRLKAIKSKIEQIDADIQKAIDNNNNYDSLTHLKEVYLKLQQDAEQIIAGGNDRKAWKMLVSTLMTALIIASIEELIDRIYGRKGWNEDTTDDFVQTLVLESFTNNIPYLSHILNAIEYDQDLGSFDFGVIQSFIDVVKNIQDGKPWYTVLFNTIMSLGTAYGIPLKNLYNLMMGIYKNVSPEGYKIDSIIKGYSDTYIMTQYREAVAAGRTNQAKGNLELVYTHKTGVASDRVLNEVNKLYSEGYNALPKNCLTSYTDEDGFTVPLTPTQSDTFIKYYSTSNEEVSNLVNISDYQTLDSESKAKMIRKVYDAYYEYAKVKATGVSSTNRLVNLLNITNGRLGLSKFVLGVNALSNIEATKNKTRKELVLERINKMRGYTKAEKLLLFYLCGFSLSETNKTVLQSFLTQKGATLKDAKSLIN